MQPHGGQSLTQPKHGVIHIRIHKARCRDLRTNIELDPDLIREAQELSRIKTKRALIHQALLEFVEHRKRLDLRELEGSNLLDPDYDHKALRAPAN